MDNNRASGWTQIESETLHEAAKCPICEVPPVVSLEDVLKQEYVFLRCPNNHPYVFCGDNLIQAVTNWNRYICLMIESDTRQMVSRYTKNINASYCRMCQNFTKSVTTFDTLPADATHLGYSVVKQQCAVCHMTKSQKDAA